MEVHISITGDDESGKKVLDILTGGGILDNLEGFRFCVSTSIPFFWQTSYR